MKKTAFLVLSFFAFFVLGTGILNAAEAVKEPNAFKRIMDVQSRGAVNIATCWGEMIRAFDRERKDHPKAWPATYFFYAFGNTLLRLGSGINDVVVLPLYVNAVKDSTPITQRFDLPDYYWKKN